ncbi:MBL fold metallo-hydrolase [Acinetobacter nosocomialis]|uniref:ComEC/Rec2 family competence protein n=1 Tax=Acinetobacter nosocomialis TaxID=106654 RepID=UPI00244C97B5|nr:MBL fold metallo-hydrolase [Acinetobacter nosocomialis]MDH2634543.1 MBL fold metallo-hydrolase [Acinetobacter nosocomialis]
MSINIRFLRAHHGDSILLTFINENNEYRILIDGGPSYTFKPREEGNIREGDLRVNLDKLIEQNKKIDLVILTHVDDDHIGGIISAFEDPDYLSKIALRVIFNSGQLIHEYFRQPLDEEKDIKGNFSMTTQTSIAQGDTLENLLINLGIWERKIYKQNDSYELGEVIFRFLSPNDTELSKLLKKWKKESVNTFTSLNNKDWNKDYKELLVNDKFVQDTSCHNGSSLSFIVQYMNKKFVFLGDAFPSTIISGLNNIGYSKENPLEADLVKISHHGSKKNTSYALLDILNSKKYVISTDSSIHGLPDKLTLARIHSHSNDSKIYFNYEELLNVGEIYSAEELVEYKDRIISINEDIEIE